jgi:hypothetical protein
VVKGFHCVPGSGLVWPNDWQPMTTAQLAAPDVAPNDAAELVVGPFSWTPSQVGHECMLMIVSAAGDPSNIDNFQPGDTIPEWRLVPHDNNIGQRNVHPVPGGGGVKGLLEGLANQRFWVRNPNRRTARIQLVATLPAFLEERGWKLGFGSAGGASFTMEPGQMKEVTLSVSPGREFTARDAAAVEPAGRMVSVETYADGILIGGMSYAVEPELQAPLPQRRVDADAEAEAAPPAPRRDTVFWLAVLALLLAVVAIALTLR